MSHTLFHHQMHQMLAHAEHQLCTHQCSCTGACQCVHSSCSCGCSCGCLDHKHSTPEEERCCSVNQQYLPSSSEDLAPVQVVDLILPLCEQLSTEHVDLAMERYRYMTDDPSLYCSVDLYRDIPLRAPPIL